MPQGRGIIFLSKGVEVMNKFLLPILYLYLKNFWPKIVPHKEEIKSFRLSNALILSSTQTKLHQGMHL